MNCPKCGAPLAPGSTFCGNCGTSFGASQPTPQPIPQQNAYNAYPATPPMTPGYQANASQIPPQYQPLSPWAYFGYSLLFALPIVGFICLIIFSASSDNINRRNFARSFWIPLCLAVIFFVICLILTLVFGVSLGALDYYF